MESILNKNYNISAVLSYCCPLVGSFSIFFFTAFSENMMDDVSSSDNIKLVQRLLRSSSALNIRPNPSEEQLSGTCCCCRNRQAKLQICHCQELDNLALKASSSRRSRSCTKHHKKRKSNTARFQRQATHLAQPASLQSAKSEASESISAHHQR